MSTQPKDGGSAFPEVFTDVPNENMGRTYSETYSAGGMTLRDYFAAAALTGLLTDPSATGTPKARADAAYQLADAMLERRAKKEL